MASTGRSARAVWFACAVVLVVFAGPVVATALTLTVAPAGAGVDARVTLAAGEPTGTVVLTKDDVPEASASRPTTDAQTIEWLALPVGYGTFRFRATLEHAGGSDSSEYVTVTVSPPAPAPPAEPVVEVGLPVLVSPSGGYAARRAPVKVRVAPNATRLELYLNDQFIVARDDLTPGTLVQLSVLSMPKGVSTIRLVASNGGSTSERSWRVRRLDYPYPTCIIIDKSDYKLYWIRKGVLVKAYPVAHGKHNCTPTRTWKILAKYKSSGVYGPRKMRLFKRVGNRWAFTAYGIHGTNQPWVIGTQASHGCIRMYNRDVLQLWPQVPIGTMVITRP